jgi:hypothetical protein
VQVVVPPNNGSEIVDGSTTPSTPLATVVGGFVTMVRFDVE